MPNVLLRPKPRLSTFRKLAIGTWQDAYDPSVYGTLSIRMDKALRYIDSFRERHGRRLTLTHLMARVVAQALEDCPDANAILRWNKLYLRDSVDLSLQVAMDDEDGRPGADLSIVKIDRVETLSLLELIDEIEGKVEKVRARQDEHLERTRSTMSAVPPLLINAVLKLMGFLLYTLNLDLRRLGLPRDAFGSAFITNVGSLGLEVAFVPLVPYSRVPIFVAPGAVREEAVVEDGRLVPGKVMTLAATFDHRFIDGAHAAVLANTARTWLEDPETHFGPIETPS
jgi:pyruvate dehydrogenase E2 component (dihydrolipoamide acetyltransferase)